MLPTRPTIKDVGRAADVSQATVSYVLNNSKAAQRISTQTQKRVRAAAERLGYKFDPTGRALQRGYNNLVTLLIVTGNLATHHAATAMALSQAAARYDLALTMHVAEDDLSAEAFIRRSVLHNSAGLLVLWDSPALEASSLRQLTARGVPIINLLPGNLAGISVVTADREDAGFRATRHLLELGHRAIGFIGDPDTRPQTTFRKHAGYRRALEAGGVSHEAAFVENVNEFGFEGGQHALSQLLERRPDITALFCINDAIALGAIDAASALGRRCPADLSVIGFGDSPEGRHWRPRLTTFARSSSQVAEEAIRLINGQRRARQTTSRAVLFPEELLLRESTGRAGLPAQASLRLPGKQKEPTRIVSSDSGQGKKFVIFG